MTIPETAVEAGIVIQHVSHTYQGQGGVVQALADVSLTLAPGSFTCFVGPSGCGKSTLCRMITGLEPPTQGEIAVHGEPVRGPGSQRVLMFQDAGLFPWLTVKDNVLFGLKLQAISRSDAEAHAMNCLRLVQLSQFAASYPHELSGGMRQRVALARALAVRPTVLLMDEPFGALDAQTREILVCELQRIWQATKTTVVYVTHNVQEAVQLGTQAIVFSAHPGRIRTIVPLADLPWPRHVSDPAVIRRTDMIHEELRDEMSRWNVKHSIWAGIWKQALFLGVIVLTWEMGSRSGFWSPALLPSPGAVAQSLTAMISTWVLPTAILQSLKMMLIGYGLAVLIGVPLGVIINYIPWLRQTLGAALLGLQTLPSVCWVPLALLWFGANMKAVLFVILGNTVFSIATATSGALSQVPPLLIQAGQTLGAKGWTLNTRVLMPAALPEIVTGLRIGWTFAWRALMAGELLSPTAGLGRLLQQGRDRGDIAEILATMFAIVLLGLFVEVAVFAKIDRRLRQKWGLAQA